MGSGQDRSRARHGRHFAAALAAICLAGSLGPVGAAFAAEVGEGLTARMGTAEPDARLPVIVTLEQQVDADRYDGRPAALLRELRATAADTQAQVTDDVSEPVRRFWLVNAFATSATPGEIRDLAADPQVARIDLDAPVRTAAVPAPLASPGDGGWGVRAIGAPSVWSELGLTGAGVRVGEIDTGVEPGNAELAGKVVAWHDFIAGGAEPYDDNGHGTHVAGTIAGSAALGSPIGVAPGAQLVVAKALDAQGVAPGSALLAAAEWITDPDGNPATADYPSIVNNSWYSSDANNTWFRPMVQAWVALGIVPVFAAGNGGVGTPVTSPASYPESIAVGATDQAGAVADFSSRGPIVWQNAAGLGPAAGTVLAKPDVVAPGVDVVSTVGAGFGAYSGTSMAAPHVSGTLALLRQARPDLSPAQLGDVLRATATDLGPAGFDGDSGAGALNALAAARSVLGVTAAAPATAASAPAPVAAAAPAPAARAARRHVSLRGVRVRILRGRVALVRGRVIGTARLRASLRLGAPVQAAHADKARFTSARHGRFTLRVPLRGLGPGRYRLSLVAVARDGSLLSAPVVRAVLVPRRKR